MANEVSILVQLVRDAIESTLYDVHTALPGTVLAFYPKTQTADIQPSLKRVYAADPTPISLPVINGVPVTYPRAKMGGVTFPLAPGDQVLIIINERSLDTWKARGGEVDPQEGRKFNLTDAVCIPGLFAPAKADGTFPTKNMEIEWGVAKMTLDPLGKFTQQGFAGLELYELLSQLIAQCALISNSSGPTNNAAAFTALGVLLNQLKGTPS